MYHHIFIYDGLFVILLDYMRLKKVHAKETGSRRMHSTGGMKIEWNDKGRRKEREGEADKRGGE